MKGTLVGMSRFPSKKTNINYVNAFFTMKDPFVDGLKVDSCMYSESYEMYTKLISIPVGSSVNIEYNSNGSIVDVERLE